ncbi:hypothetical protein IMCC3135_28765 [Granulosicoccus antarcticus IMCC3135]|uniref:Uncharacterized protein n=1 Tax=Granulosicoccus antarcticus IMCC3135 TaxID=1192854 RepID=A0A2Z2NZE8_9GAMM|nr:hypothetical protein IMCC3135_28765 [Granulosicoccus antarcticus IMCC3135]
MRRPVLPLTIWRVNESENLFCNACENVVDNQTKVPRISVLKLIV